MASQCQGPAWTPGYCWVTPRSPGHSPGPRLTVDVSSLAMSQPRAPLSGPGEARRDTAASACELSPSAPADLSTFEHTLAGPHLQEQVAIQSWPSGEAAEALCNCSRWVSREVMESWPAEVGERTPHGRLGAARHRRSQAGDLGTSGLVCPCGETPRGLVGSRPWDLGLRGSPGRLRVSVMYLRGFF